jgi:hypothetical protein
MQSGSQFCGDCACAGMTLNGLPVFEPKRHGNAYLWGVLRHAQWHRVRVGLVVSLILVFAGIVIDSLFSASPALDDGLLAAAAAVIVLAFLLTRGRDQA